MRNFDGIPMGQHSKVCQSLSEVFHMRLPEPKYTAIWNISKVIDYISTLGDNKKFFTKIIIFKLTSLAILPSEPQK